MDREGILDERETANNFMRVATVYGGKSLSVWDLIATACMSWRSRLLPQKSATASGDRPKGAIEGRETAPLAMPAHHTAVRSYMGRRH